MSELLLNTIVEKLSMHSMDVDAIRERIENLPANLDVIKNLQAQLTSVEKTIQKISFPEKELKQLAFDLNRAILILQQPVKKRSCSSPPCSKFSLGNCWLVFNTMHCLFRMVHDT